MDSRTENTEYRAKIEQHMEQALREERFMVYYQPKHDTQTGKLVGAEALIRWVHPDLGFVSPGDFIPVFEKNGFIFEVDTYVWGKSCENLRKWRDKGIPVVPISVNSSRVELTDDKKYFERRTELAKKWNVPADLLHIEVTETMFGSRMEEVVETLRKCHDYGFGIELDDFGIGYSSLHTLGDLPLDIVKLDMSFVQQLDDPKKERVMTGCVNLIKNMNLKIVAEGVETERQYRRVKELDIDIVQGYYYSKPLPEKEFEEYLMRVPIISPEEAQSRDASRRIDVASFGNIDQCQYLLSHLMSGLLNMWVSVFVIDVKTGRSTELCDTQDFKQLITESVMSAEIMDMYIQKSLMPKYQAPYRAFFDFSTMEARFRDEHILTLEFEDYHNGWMRSTILPAGYDVDGHLTHIVLAVERINSEKQELTQMQRMSEEDNLTGLHNRFSGTIAVNQLLLQRKPFEMMLMDIDHFKQINDTYGHHVGDEVLVTLSQTLQSDFPDADAIRLGGDEFMLVIKGKQGRTMLTERLQAFFRHFANSSIPGMDKRVPLAVSIGGVFYDGREQKSFDELYRTVDHYLYESKQFEGCYYVSDDYCMPDLGLTFSILQQYRQHYNQSNDALYNIHDEQSWLTYLNENAAMKYEMCRRNQQHIDQLTAYFERHDVPDTSYDYLYDLVQSHFFALDPFMTEHLVGDILLPHYRNKPVRDLHVASCIAQLCCIFGESLFNIFVMGDHEALPRSMAVFREAIQVSETMRPDSPAYYCRVYAFAQLLGHPGIDAPFIPSGEEALKLYMQLHGIILSVGLNCGSERDDHYTSVVQSATTYPILRALVLHQRPQLNEAQQKEKELLISFIRQHLTPEGDYDLLAALKVPNALIRQALPVLMGWLDDRQIFENLRHAYLSLPDAFFEHINRHIGPIVSSISGALHQIDRIDFTEEQKHEYTRECWKVITRVLHSHKDSQINYEINRVTSLVFSSPVLCKFLSAEEKLNFLLQTVGYTMLFTTGHSIATAKYSELIAQCVINERPELMVGLFGYQNVEEVRAHSQQILKFLHTGCLLHDLGKIRMREIVNNVFRKLSDHEKKIIRLHPHFGVQSLMIDPSLMAYRDLVLGHHKWYNGQGGYPADFDNTQSPVRILIDIVAIADTIEAATSHLGRSYRKPKSFEEIMTELRHLSGTRYNRDVVYAIFCSHETYITLEQLIDVNWNENYRTIFQEFLK